MDEHVLSALQRNYDTARGQLRHANQVWREINQLVGEVERRLKEIEHRVATIRVPPPL